MISSFQCLRSLRWLKPWHNCLTLALALLWGALAAAFWDQARGLHEMLIFFWFYFDFFDIFSDFPWMGKLLFAGMDDDFDANDRSELQMAGQDWECTRSIFVQECYVASLCQIVEKTRKHHFVLWKTRQNKEISFCVFLCNTVWIGLVALGLAILGLDLDFVRILLGLSMTAPRGSCPSSMSSLCFGQNCRCQRAHSERNFFSYDSYDWLHEPGLSKPIYSGNQGNQGSKDLITWLWDTASA